MPRCVCHFCEKVFYPRHKQKHCSKECLYKTWEKQNPIEKRFWEKVQKARDGCWIWIAAVGTKGYGVFNYTLAHRVAWELAYGDIPDGKLVCHHCDNPPCVRPDHLFIGTNKDNNQDMIRKGRHRYLQGEESGNNVLTDEKVREIRRLHQQGQMTQREIARQMGVSFATVCHIVNRKTWRHIG